MIEAMSGTMYVAILIARLVGVHSARKSETRRDTATFTRAMHINFEKRTPKERP
jgi:hypothetical protein